MDKHTKTRLRTVNADKLSVTDWPVGSSRPRRPFLIHETRVIADDNWAQEGHAASQIAERLYLRDTIHPHLLRVEAGNVESLTQFLTDFGAIELLEAVVASGILTLEVVSEEHVWPFIIDSWLRAVEHGRVIVFRESLLEKAWTNPAIIDWFAGEQHWLKSGLTAAAEGLDAFGRTDYLAPVVRVLWDPQEQRFIEEPGDIFHRSWLELLDKLETYLPRFCLFCQLPFVPGREGQKYCPGTDCYEQDFHRTYSKDPYRREYQRLYKQYKRGTISQREWDDWREKNQGPRKAKEKHGIR